MPLPDPELDIDETGTPRSAWAGDVYFSADDGPAETAHVFLAGIGAPEVWKSRRRMRIGELGFGTGLNFLLTWRAWRESASADATLDYVAVEGFPLSADDIRCALSRYSNLTAEVAALTHRLPHRVPGMHRIALDGGRVRLTLVYGQVAPALAMLTGRVDAWYLDGFAPSKNPDMWTPEVLAAVAARTVPGGRLATFTAAGAVRRGLEAAGFTVEKRPGFGRKRECLAASMPGDAVADGLKPGARVAVIGAGIAGGALSKALAERGYAVTLIDAAGPGAGSSGNPAALIAPRLPKSASPMGRVLASGYLHAVRYYDALAAAGVAVWLGRRGTFAMARDDAEQERQQASLRSYGLPEVAMRGIDAAEAGRLTGIACPRPGLWFAEAGTLDPRAVVPALAAKATDFIQAEVARIERGDDGWRVLGPDGATVASAEAAVVAAGSGLKGLFPAAPWPLRANRGQIGYLPASEGGPAVPVSYGGYLTPAVRLPAGGMGHVIGASYGRTDPAAAWETFEEQDHREIAGLLSSALPALAVLADAPPVGGRVSLRATIPDYTPLAGGMDEGLYVLGGLGSRGFLTAPLMAERIADAIAGLPPPLPADLLAAVDPKRFV